MRLRRDQVESIKSTIGKFDSAAEVFLFGSRVDDDKRGGDIDLLVKSSKISLNDRRRIKLALYDVLGEQKIDILVSDSDDDPFVRIAMHEGVKL